MLMQSSPEIEPSSQNLQEITEEKDRIILTL
jgi:hypothetical protein